MNAMVHGTQPYKRWLESSEDLRVKLEAGSELCCTFEQVYCSGDFVQHQMG